MISISKTKPENIIIDNDRLQFTESVTMLGLKITRTGILRHITERMNKAKTELAKLKRFVKLKRKTKSHLYN